MARFYDSRCIILMHAVIMPKKHFAESGTIISCQILEHVSRALLEIDCRHASLTSGSIDVNQDISVTSQPSAGVVSYLTYAWGAVTSLFLPYLWSVHYDAMLWI